MEAEGLMDLFDEAGTQVPNSKWVRSLGSGLGLAAYASSYWEAAKELSQSRLKDGRGSLNQPRAIGVYPIVFLYRHAFELMLKSIVLDHKPEFIIEPTRVIARKHRLDPYTSDLKTLEDSLPKYSDGSQKRFVSEEEWRLLDTVIRGWSETDPSSMRFRYSVDLNGDPNVTVSPDFAFNFESFVDQMDEALDVLEGLYRELDSWKHWEAEELAGIHEWIRDIEGSVNS